jgi:hypothetical protein
MLVSVSNIDIRLILYKLRELWRGWLHSHPASGLCTDLAVGRRSPLISHTFFLHIMTSSLATRKLYHTHRQQANIVNNDKEAERLCAPVLYSIMAGTTSVAVLKSCVLYHIMAGRTSVAVLQGCVFQSSITLHMEQSSPL